jgi:hypothetical protein
MRILSPISMTITKLVPCGGMATRCRINHDFVHHSMCMHWNSCGVVLFSSQVVTPASSSKISLDTRHVGIPTARSRNKLSCIINLYNFLDSIISSLVPGLTWTPPSSCYYRYIAMPELLSISPFLTRFQVPWSSWSSETYHWSWCVYVSSSKCK